jgi:hypothetical protein
MFVTPVVNDVPFPVDVSFTSHGGPLLVFFAGSAFHSSGGKITANLALDGNVLASASVFTNEANSHKALVPVFVYTCSVSAGAHKFTVTKGANTQIDHNDYFTITVTEFSLS